MKENRELLADEKVVIYYCPNCNIREDIVIGSLIHSPTGYFVFFPQFNCKKCGRLIIGDIK